MHYHIGNMLIHQEFQSGKSCPLCRIRNILENRLTEQYLNDAVMEDDQRKKVNERGFCAHHTQMMLARKNKLSLALQHVTRITTLKGKLEVTDDAKRARKQAEFFAHSRETCVICDSVEESMVRYYKTIAEMFEGEQGFADRLRACGGFCFEHYAALLEHVKYAHGKQGDYVYALSKLQKEAVNALLEDLYRFCSKHDYRNADMPWEGAETALLRAVSLLHGEEAK